jgi:hypothetical protein
LDATASSWQHDRRIFARSRLYMATAFRWLMAKAEASIRTPTAAERRDKPGAWRWFWR